MSAAFSPIIIAGAFVFCAVERGSCWIAMADGPYQRLEAGDCFVLSKGWSFVLTQNPALPPLDAYSLICPGHLGVQTSMAAASA